MSLLIRGGRIANELVCIGLEYYQVRSVISAVALDIQVNAISITVYSNLYIDTVI